MDNSDHDYHISFFRPTTPHTTANRNMVLGMVSTWFIAIFGFQFLLWVIEKPTPEPAYITFQDVWGAIESGDPSNTELQELGKAALSVLGKIAISPDDKIALDYALSWSVYQLTDDTQKENLVKKVRKMETLKSEISNISDEEYINMKLDLSTTLSPMLKLSVLDVRSKILPLELTSESMDNLTRETKEVIPGIMKKYLVHNQSFLTDTKFLGFPFHYFYTSVFLLILFIGLCLTYCIKIDLLNAKLHIEE